MASFEHVINIMSRARGTASGSWSSGDYAEAVEIDTSKYDGTVRYFVSFVLYSTYSGPSGESDEYGARLYDITNSAVVTNSTYTKSQPGSPSNPVLGPMLEITEYIASLSAPAIITVQESASRNAGVCKKAMIHIVQNGVITKTRTFINLSGDSVNGTTSYAGLSYPKDFLYDSTKYDTVSIGFHAGIWNNTSTRTTTVQLYDVTSAAAITSSQLSTTGNTHVYAKTSYGLSVTTGHEIGIQIKNDAAGGSAEITNGFLVIDQSSTTPLTKTLCVTEVTNIPTNSSNTSLTPVLCQAYYNNNNYQGCTVDFKAQYIIDDNGFGTGVTADTTDDGTTITSSSVFDNSGNIAVLLTSGSLTAPTGDGNVIDNRLKDTLGVFGVNIYTGRLLISVTSMTQTHSLPSAGVGN